MPLKVLDLETEMLYEALLFTSRDHRTICMTCTQNTGKWSIHAASPLVRWTTSLSQPFRNAPALIQCTQLLKEMPAVDQYELRNIGLKEKKNNDIRRPDMESSFQDFGIRNRIPSVILIRSAVQHIHQDRKDTNQPGRWRSKSALMPHMECALTCFCLPTLGQPFYKLSQST